MRGRQWVMVMAAVCLVACGGSDATTAGGVADRVGDAAAYRALPTQLLEPVARLCVSGAQACDVPQSSGGVVAANGDALVRVVGARSGQVVLVRAGSDSAVAIGAEGAGPGEYRAPVEIGLDDAGNIHVLDLFTRRALHFASDGTPLREGVVQLPPAPHPVMRFVNGALWMLSADNPGASGDTLPSFVYEMRDGGPAEQRHEVDLRLASFGAGEFRVMPRTFAAVPQLAFGADGRLVYAPAHTAELELLDASGARVAQGGFRVEGRPVTPEDLEAAVERSLRRLPPGPMRDQLAEQMQNAAERHPGVTQLLVTADGEVWAREAPEAGTDSIAWLVYAADLTPQARVRMGADDRPVGTHGDRILLARSGEDEASTGYWWMRRR